MQNTMRYTNQDVSVFSKNWGWFVAWGVALFVIGLCAISAATFTTLLSIVFLGVIMLAAGVIVLFDTFTSWSGKGSGFYLHLFMGFLYVAAGIMLISNPVQGSISITFLLAVFYTCLGLFRIVYSLYLRVFNWGWSLLNGLITLALGIMIMMAWPASSLFVIGLFVGIDLLFVGIAYIAAGLTAKNYVVHH